MVDRRALAVVGARSRRGHDAWAVARVGRRRAWPSYITGRRVTGHVVLLVFGTNLVLRPRTTSTYNRGWSSSWCGVARPSLRSVHVV